MTAYNTFEHIRSQSIASLNITVHEYHHRNTGAQHVHIEANSDENVFLVAFRTVPHDSTGVAHILEHTALCGSEKFPVRDPFFLMTRRSLNTFMNAFTSSDWTAYPFASQNKKDFNNLLSVYLDAAFFATLDPLDFSQEGHRLEFETIDDANSPLLFKGVVYNEMKGAMSSVTSTLWQTLCKYLYPTSTYHHNSGGDPANIPDLTYEQLVAFYRTHYHPSNAIFMTFGDIPAAEHQKQFETLALHRFNRLDDLISVKPEKRHLAPIRVEEAYALDENPDNKTHIVVGWLLGDSADLDAQLQAQLLTSVLLDNAASPLMQALETTQLGKSPSPLCGIENSQKELLFVAGLEGSEPDQTKQVEYLILNALKNVAEHGIKQDRIEACLHQLELQQREISGDGYPYGLQLILQALNSATHRGDPIALLDLEPALARLRQQATQPDFIPNLIRTLLLDNPHRVTLTLRPDTTYSARQESAEKACLEKIRRTLTAADCTDIIARSKALLDRQNKTIDDSVLPRVQLEDVPPLLQIPPVHGCSVTPLKITTYQAGTNGLMYEQMIVPLPALDQQELALLPLYTAFINDVGVAGADYLHTQQRQSAVCGGLRAYTTMRGDVLQPHNVSGYFVLSTKALSRNHALATDLLRDTWLSPRFDEQQRLRELMAQLRIRTERSLTNSGHNLAMTAASAGTSPLAWHQHQHNGLGAILPLRQLEQSLDSITALEQFMQSLTKLHQKLLQQPAQFLLVAEPDHLPTVSASLTAQWPAATSTSSSHLALPTPQTATHHFWQTSTQVNFCARSWPTVGMAHPDAAALTVLGGYLRNEFLHRAIREQGGAYGGGASQDSTQGSFRMYSYRDPRLKDTFADFDHAIDWLHHTTPDPQKIEQAILGVVASMDKPGSPAGEAKSAFHNRLFGRDDTSRNVFRTQILSVTGADLIRVGSTYLLPEKAHTAVLGSASATTEVAQLGLTVCKL